MIPARGELEWSLRPYPGFDRAGWDREVAALAAAIDPQITIEHDDRSRAVRVRRARRAASARSCARSARSTSGPRPRCGPQHGIDAIVIGPGDIAQAHAADEFVPLDDLDWAVGLFRSLVRP